MIHRCLIYLLAITISLSCTALPSDFVVEGVEIAEHDSSSGELPEDLTINITLRNDSQRNITIRDAQITTQIKGDDLITFTLQGEVEMAAQTTTQVSTSWGVERNDPATLYSMRRHPIERYIDRLTFDYSINVAGLRRHDKRLKKKGLSAADLDINIEKLLR